MASTPRWPLNSSVYSLKSEEPEISASGATWKRESDLSPGGRGDIAVNGFVNQEHHSDMQDFNCNNSSATHEDSNGCEMEKDESVAVDSHKLASVHDNPFFRRLGVKHQHKHESGHERGEKRFVRQLSDSDRDPKSFNDEELVEYKPGSGYVHKLLDRFSHLSAREESSTRALKEKRSLSLENLAEEEKSHHKAEKHGLSTQHGDQLNHRAISVESLNHKPLSLRNASHPPPDHASHKKPCSPRDNFPDVNFAREDIIIIEQPSAPQPTVRSTNRRGSSGTVEIVSLKEDVDKKDELPKPNTVSTVRSIFEKAPKDSSKRRNLSTSSISPDGFPTSRVHGSTGAKSTASSVIQRESLSASSTPREPFHHTPDVTLRSQHGAEVPKPTEQRNSAELPVSSSRPKKPELVRRSSASDVPPSPTKARVGKKIVSSGSSTTPQQKDQKKAEGENTHLIFSTENLASSVKSRKDKRNAPSVPPSAPPPVVKSQNSRKEKEATSEPLTPRGRVSGGLRKPVGTDVPASKPTGAAPPIPARNDVKPKTPSSADLVAPAATSTEVAKESVSAVREIFTSQDMPVPSEPVSPPPRETVTTPREVSTPREPSRNGTAAKEAVSIPKKPTREEKENRQHSKLPKPPTPRVSQQEKVDKPRASQEKVEKPVKAEPPPAPASSSDEPPVGNHTSSEDGPIKGVPTIVAMRMKKSKDPSVASNVISQPENFGVALKPSKRPAPAPPGSDSSANSSASSQNSADKDEADGGNIFRKKLKPRDMNTGVALVFDSSQVDRKPAETVVPRLDLSGLEEPDKPQHGYQEGYRPTKIRPCKIQFIGANVILEKSNLKKKARVTKGVITFADNLTKLFEYPSEQCELEAYLSSHPEEEAEMVFLQTDLGESTDDVEVEEEEPETPRGGGGGGSSGAREKEADAVLKSNTALSHSAGFSSYQPKNVMEYEFGAVLKEPDPPKVAPQEPPPPDPDSLELRPAEEVDVWSTSTNSDLLF